MIKNLFGSKRKVRTKHPSLVTDEMSYQNGGNNPVKNAYKNYISSVQPLDNAIRILGNIASGARFEYYKKQKNGKKKKVKVAQFDDLFMNDYQSISDFIRLCITTLASYDALYIVGEKSKDPNRKGLIDLFILDNNRLEIEPSHTNTIKHYTYRGATGQEIEYEPEEVIYISMNSDVTNILYSLPRLRSLNSLVESYLNSNSYFNTSAKSGGKRSAIVTGESFMNDDERKEVKKALNKFFNSTDPRILMLDEDLDVNIMSDTTSASQLLDTLTYINKTFYEHYQIPKILLGDYSEASTDSVVRLTARIFFSTVLKPWFQTLSLHLSRYGRQQLGIQDFWVEVDYSGIDILEDSFRDTVELGLDMQRQGNISADEFRETVGLDPINSKWSGLHMVSQFLTGKEPLSFENLDDDIQQYSTDGQNITSSDVPPGPGGDLNGEMQNGSN